MCNPGEVTRPLSVTELVGLDEEDTFAQKRRTRFKRCSTWLSEVSTPLLVAVGCTLLVPLTQFMGTFFNRARLGNTADAGLIEFIRPSSSPARMACLRLIALLANPDDTSWLCIRNVSAWTEQQFSVVGDQMLKVVAGLFYRMLYTLEQWPFRLGQLLGSDSTATHRASVARDFMHCQPSCFEPGFSRPVREVCAGDPARLQDPVLLAAIADGLRHCPCQNIQNEDRCSGKTRAIVDECTFVAMQASIPFCSWAPHSTHTHRVGSSSLRGLPGRTRTTRRRFAAGRACTAASQQLTSTARHKPRTAWPWGSTLQGWPGLPRSPSHPAHALGLGEPSLLRRARRTEETSDPWAWRGLLCRRPTDKSMRQQRPSLRRFFKKGRMRRRSPTPLLTWPMSHLWLRVT